ncbi:branched-chain amino acid transport system ATP-binding protein [Natronocella acetinitrilica]|uniref:Branched-chain amino acid transport system ATP-binding protein n=1 Tax=Natronocella acetinitrilica TaxID=414046 RepID=A0AAE3KAH0_9GAMM|nr:ABC transporter ATP-binding protein [Natronocella acetinitrilica]MCP1673401.1 branched-chain amino acid transport system ATP-binding protein [Natronocella acetinitrilica]
MARAILNVQNLHKSFGGLIAIDDCSFEVESGTIFGIIGPNGAGKTTLFNMLTGFLSANSGTITFDGREVNRLKPHQVVELGIARTFQVMKPYYEMTVWETLQVSRQCKRVRSRYSDAAIINRMNMDLLARLGLEDKADMLVDELTQGDLRLVDIGRALATEPQALFLDEPFSGLGGEASDRLSALLTSLRDDGVTIVIIEHRLRELMRLVSTVMAINFGAVLAKGTPEEIVKNPDVIEAYLGRSGGSLSATAS